MSYSIWFLSKKNIKMRITTNLKYSATLFFFSSFFSVQADCISAQNVCEEANNAYSQCIAQNPLTGAAVCSPLFNVKISVCSQADYECSKSMSSDKVFATTKDAKAYKDALTKSQELVKNSFKAISQ